MGEPPRESQIILSGFDRAISRRTSCLAVALSVLGLPFGIDNAVRLVGTLLLILSGDADLSLFAEVPDPLLPTFVVLAVAEVAWRVAIVWATFQVIAWAFRAVRIWLRPTTPAIWTRGAILYIDLGWGRRRAPLDSLEEATLERYRKGPLKGDPVLVVHSKRGRPRRYPLKPLDAEPDTLLYRLNSLIDEPPPS